MPKWLINARESITKLIQTYQRRDYLCWILIIKLIVTLTNVMQPLLANFGRTALCFSDCEMVFRYRRIVFGNFGKIPMVGIGNDLTQRPKLLVTNFMKYVSNSERKFWSRRYLVDENWLRYRVVKFIYLISVLK